jgi:hypothetical protein
MTPDWQVAYVFAGRSVGEIAPVFVGGLSLLALGIAGLVKHRAFARPFDQHGDLRWPFVVILAGLFFVGFEGALLFMDRRLASVISHGACETVSGRITHIEPDHGGGDREFTIGSRVIHYDNHAVGFEGQLCNDIDVCQGDTARVCLNGGEIGRVEKWVGTALRSPQ